MNRAFVRATIVVVIIFELLWALELRNGFLPRSPETVEAIKDYQTSPSETTKATMREQMKRDSSHNTQHDQILLVILLLIDLTAIYFFWNYRAKKPSAQSPV